MTAPNPGHGPTNPPTVPEPPVLKDGGHKDHGGHGHDAPAKPPGKTEKDLPKSDFGERMSAKEVMAELGKDFKKFKAGKPQTEKENGVTYYAAVDVESFKEGLEDENADDDSDDDDSDKKTPWLLNFGAVASILTLLLVGFLIWVGWKFIEKMDFQNDAPINAAHAAEVDRLKNELLVRDQELAAERTRPPAGARPIISSGDGTSFKEPYVPGSGTAGDTKARREALMSGGDVASRRAEEVGRTTKLWLTEHDEQIRDVRKDVTELQQRPIVTVAPSGNMAPRAAGGARTFVDPKGRTWSAEAIEAAVATQQGIAARYAAMLTDDPDNGFARESKAEAEAKAEGFRKILKSLQ